MHSSMTCVEVDDSFVFCFFFNSLPKASLNQSFSYFDETTNKGIGGRRGPLYGKLI